MSPSPDSLVPLKGLRLVSLFLTWAWGVIAGGTGLNALIKSNQSQSFLKHSVPAPTVLTINVKDVFESGVVATTICALIATLCSLYSLLLILPHRSTTTTPLSTRTLRLQTITLAVCSLWLFAVQVPYTLFFATRSAEVHAFVGSIELPAQIIQKVEQQTGATSVYKHIPYLKLTAVFPWITLLFTIVTTVITFIAMSRVRSGVGLPAPAADSTNSSMVEKDGAASHHEKSAV